MTFSEGLLVLHRLADTEDKRFRHAAARWHARFTLEATWYKRTRSAAERFDYLYSRDELREWAGTLRRA